MKITTHHHPRYIIWLKYFIFTFIFILFLESLYTDLSIYSLSGSIVSAVLDILIFIPLYSISLLISAYYFGQNIIVTDDGLLIEFLWKDLIVSWDKIIEIKPVYGYWRTSQNQKYIYVVLTDALTPFHRFFGLIYGLSVKPAFIIFPTISEYQSLVEAIKKHAKKN